MCVCVCVCVPVGVPRHTRGLMAPALESRMPRPNAPSPGSGATAQDYAPAILGQKTYGGLDASVYSVALDTDEQDAADMSV